MKDIKSLDVLYERTLNFYDELALYIAAGEEKLAQIDRDDIPAREAAIEAGGDDFMAKSVPDAVLHAKMKAMTRIAGLRRQLSLANTKLEELANCDGLTGLCITKLDVLDGLSELKLCTGYLLDGQTTDILPLGAEAIARCTPIYETLPGWSESTVGVTEYDRLPAAARQYLERIEEIGGVPVHLISTSPDRAHTILRRHPFAASAV